jgi:hypothetical protein
MQTDPACVWDFVLFYLIQLIDPEGLRLLYNDTHTSSDLFNSSTKANVRRYYLFLMSSRESSHRATKLNGLLFVTVIATKSTLTDFEAVRTGWQMLTSASFEN